jgi:long-chain acyl-CoA synthetase
VDGPVETRYDDRPWLQWYAPGVPAEVQVPNVPLTALLDNAVTRFPRRAALVFLGRKVSYRELGHAVDRLAWALGNLGVRKGDRVAVMLPNCPQQVIVFFAVLRRGGIVVMHNPLYTVPELRTQLADCGARIAVTFDRGYAKLIEAREGTAVEHVIVTSLTDYLPAMKRRALRLPVKRAREARTELTAPLPKDATFLSLRELLRKSQDWHYQVPLDPIRDIAVLQYTGGTTGTPKGAMLSHQNLVANACQTAVWDPAAQPGREVGIAVLPFFHVFGLTMCLTTSVLMGATTVLIPKFDLDLIFDAIRKFRPTIFPGVPTIYQQIAASPKARGAGMNTIRVCISGAMQLRRQTIDEFRLLTGAHVVQGYGMTETSPVTMANPLNGNARHVSIGLPVPGTQARVVSETDPSVIMPVGEAGELVIRGPQVFRGYWNQPEETARVLIDGWIRTGDIALMSPDGFFTLIDRKRDVIIVDGFNVYPSEVEETLNTHPAVAESAVIGVPDPVHGERVHAYAVLRPGETPEAGELVRFCAERLTDYKVPDDIEIRQELPHNLLGKVLRRLLKAEHIAGWVPRYATPARPVPESAPRAGESAARPGEPAVQADEPVAEAHKPAQADEPAAQAGEPVPRADEPVAQAEEPVPQTDEPVPQADAKISG